VEVAALRPEAVAAMRLRSTTGAVAAVVEAR
jgi:hypothetical protein